MATSARVHEFEVTVDRDGTARSALGGPTIPRDDAWWAEHLVLAGLVRCTIASLGYADKPNARSESPPSIAATRAKRPASPSLALACRYIRALL